MKKLLSSFDTRQQYYDVIDNVFLVTFYYLHVLEDIAIFKTIFLLLKY